MQMIEKFNFVFMFFSINKSCTKSKARAGVLNTHHQQIETPIFMPVGTIGSVKTIHQRELADDIKATIILGNTYHLYLKPGIDVLHKAGGLHKFIGWDRAMLTDSGGFQVYSLGKMRKITQEGVRFKSHIDGSYHYFTPESVMKIQRYIGADIIMAFDECTPYPCDYSYAKKSMVLTHDWLIRCMSWLMENEPVYDFGQYFFPIVQGSVYKDLRRESAEFIASAEAPGNAIGGLSVGEPEDELYEMADIVTDILPKDKPRYLMGVGTPWNILECISLGIDMFDCVMPTRNARNGMLFTLEGTINIKNLKWKEDFSILDSNGTSYVDHSYSKAYLRHLFNCNEYLAKQIASLHNLAFYLNLVTEARKKIIDGTFYEWKENIIPKLKQRL